MLKFIYLSIKVKEIRKKKLVDENEIIGSSSKSNKINAIVKIPGRRSSKLMLN